MNGECAYIKKEGVDSVTVLCYTASIKMAIGGFKNVSVTLGSRKAGTITPCRTTGTSKQNKAFRFKQRAEGSNETSQKAINKGHETASL
jgi:hypothetical protein